MDDFAIVNVRLLSHPVNWLFVWVTLALTAMGYQVIHDHWMAGKSADNISPG